MIEGTCLCGAVRWTYRGDPGSATACNCSACRRYGALWIYDHTEEHVTLNGETRVYERPGGGTIRFHFCPACGTPVAWTFRRADAHGKWPIAVNVRTADLDAVRHLPIDHFDGADTFDDLPSDGRTVRDMWF